MKKSTLLLLFLLKGMALQAQLVQTEASSGFHRSSLSHFSSLRASLKAGIRVNTLAFFQKYHLPQNSFLDETGFQLTVLKQFYSGFSAGPFFYYNSFAGMMKTLSLNYLKSGKSLTIGFTPSVGYSHKEKALFSELNFQLGYRKHLSAKWDLMSSFQALTNWTNTQKETRGTYHSRSLQYLRIGLSNKNNWQLGLALD